jgi:tetratricopeptide (TPR) repeat protein
MSTWDRRLGDGKMYARRGELERAREAYRDAWEAAEDDRERSRALGGLGVVSDRLGDAVALTLLEEAVELARASDRSELSLRLHDLGVCRLGRGVPSSVDALEEAWPGHDDDEARLMSLEMLGEAALRHGSPRQADSVFMQLSWMAEEMGRPMVSLKAVNGRGEALRRMGRMEEAKRSFQGVVEALAGLHAPTREQQEQAGVALHNLGIIMMALRPDAARQMLEQAIACFRAAYETSHHSHVARSLAFLGRLAAEQGRVAEADALWAEARSLVPPSDPVVTELLPLLTVP